MKWGKYFFIVVVISCLAVAENVCSKDITIQDNATAISITVESNLPADVSNSNSTLKVEIYPQINISDQPKRNFP
ncbi:MAG: hypothetical protein Q9M37_04760 [Desulfonauticus sp.]|nr:hypothetical protein [Desulfonauticus sp.]